MKKMARGAALTMTVLLGMGISLSAYAEQGPGSRLSDEKREEVRNKIETVRIWRLTETLRLNEATAAKLSAHLSSFDKQRRELAREQIKAVQDLREALNSAKPAESKLRQYLDKIEKGHHAIEELKAREFSGLKGILNTEQQARYLIFQHEFQREMRDMIREARGEDRGPMEHRGPRMRDGQRGGKPGPGTEN